MYRLTLGSRRLFVQPNQPILLKGMKTVLLDQLKNVNFVEAAKMISLSFGKSAGAAGDTWYAPFVTILSNGRAIPESVTTFEKAITRGEMAEMVYRLKANVTNKDSLTFASNQLTKAAPAPVPSTPLPPATEAPTETVETETNQTTELLPETNPEAELLASAGAEYKDLNPVDWEADLGNKMIALFFHASWCPSCVKLDKEITSRLSELPDNSVVFKVDYDKEKALRQQFGVTSQHTAVFVNTDKQASLRKAGFSFKDLMDNL